jgi:hypothetical protein
MAVRISDGQQALEGGDLGWRSAAQLPPFIFRIGAIDVSGTIESVDSQRQRFSHHQTSRYARR